MDYIIKGINLTNGCFSCPFSSFSQLDNMLVCKCNGHLIRDIHHPEGCPLIPLPENHGRLIDADELLNVYSPETLTKEEILSMATEPAALKITMKVTELFRREIKKMPTVIEAEGYHENNIQSV